MNVLVVACCGGADRQQMQHIVVAAFCLACACARLAVCATRSHLAVNGIVAPL